MAQSFFEKYPESKIVEKPSEELIDKYKNLLPESLINFWSNYGFGMFMNGYLKIVNPDSYQEIYNIGYDNTTDDIVFAATGLGDLIAWTGHGSIRFVNFRHGVKDFLQSDDDFNWFLNKVIIDDYCLEEEIMAMNYFPAKEKNGDLTFDECFGYVPLLGLGGSEKVENLQKVKIREYILLITEMSGIIE